MCLSNRSTVAGVYVPRETKGVRPECRFTGSLWDDCEVIQFNYHVHMLQYYERERYTRPSFTRWDGAVTDTRIICGRSPLSQSQQDDRFNGRYDPPALADLGF